MDKQQGDPLQPQFVAAEAQSMLAEMTGRLSISGAVNRQLDAKVVGQQAEIKRLRKIIVGEFDGDPDKEYDCLKLKDEEFEAKYAKKPSPSDAAPATVEASQEVTS